MRFLLAFVLLSATVSWATALDGSSGSRAERRVPDAQQPHCRFDEIHAKQLDGVSLQHALSAGRFRATALSAPTRTLARASDDAAAVDSAEWSPIRIVIYTEDVYDSSKYCTVAGQKRPDFEGSQNNCTEDDILTAAKQDLLVNTMIPAAIAMHSARLSVKPLSRITVGTSVGTSLSGSICGSFTAPDDVKANGVTDADFVLFVAAGPITGNTVAWATTCGYADNNRPVIGVVNVKPQYIDGTDQSIRTMAHEILHALGFHYQMFASSDMLYSTSGLRGKPLSYVVFSENVIREVGNHYTCENNVGMELDDSGGDGTALSHWNSRSAYDELMSGYVGPAMRYTAMTIAAMEDMGFYKGNYANAEHMNWGYKAGCGLQDNTCVISGVSQFTDMFCTAQDTPDSPLRCTTDRLGTGYCDLGEYTSNLPSYYQYFTSARLGGIFNVEYCPKVQRFTNTRCTDGDSMLMPKSLVGASSRCVDKGSNSRLYDTICVDVACDTSAQTYKVTFLGGVEAVNCPEGATVDAAESSTSFTSGSTIICPSFASVCNSIHSDNSNSNNTRSTSVAPTVENTEGDESSHGGDLASLGSSLVACAVVFACLLLYSLAV